LIMKIGPLPDAVESGLLLRYALDPGFHCVRAHWIRGFMAFRLVRAHAECNWRNALGARRGPGSDCVNSEPLGRRAP